MSQVLKNDKFARSSIRGTVALGRKSQGSMQKHTGAQKCANEEPFGRGKLAWSPCHHRATGSQRREHISGRETWAYSRKSLGFQTGERNHHCMGQKPAALWAVWRQAWGEMLLRKLLRACGEDGGARDMESGGESCFRRWMSGEHTEIL